MSLFPHDKTPKPRALLMFLLGWLLFAAALAGSLLLTPAFVILAIPSGMLLGWFGMEFFAGAGP